MKGPSRPQRFRSTRSLPRVLGVLSDRRTISRIHQAFGASAHIVSSREQFEIMAARTLPDLIVVEARDSNGDSLAASVSRLRVLRPRATIAVYVNSSTANYHEVLRLGAAGATKLIISDLDDSPSALHYLAQVSASMSIASEASGSFAKHFREPHLSAIRYCLEHAVDNPVATEVAAALGISRRTISNWSVQMGFRGCRGMVSASRAIVAIGLLIERSCSPAHVVEILGFSSPTHLNSTLRRYAGTSIGEIRRCGETFEYWCEIVRAHSTPPIAFGMLDRTSNRSVQ